MASFFHANKSVPLPMEFINKYMISANATYVKVYLYGLAKCYEGNEDVSNAQIAEALDILETDVSKAWRYWKKVGLVHSEGKGTLVFDAVGRSQEKDASPKENTKEYSEKENVQKTKPSSMKEISKAMGINPKMKETVTMAEQLLKKTLSQREVTSLYHFMQSYSMSQEMVLVLLEYCVTIDKTNFSYIEKVAEGWNEQGINTLEEATKVLNRVTKEARMIKKCKKMFGLEREFSQTEANYIAGWITQLGMSESLIRTAYERTVKNTGKVSMPYMNTILKAWHEKGIKTVSQIAEKEALPPKKDKGRSTGYQLDDMAAIERKLRLQKQKN
ncbi:MAG: DnaD domain protein [Clostridia bacterium]|nr:DnaD domain protein [Clostridia bacterium]